MKKTVIFLFVSTLIGQTVFADVIPVDRRDHRKIQVSVSDSMIGFQLCSNTDCHQIGKKSAYSLKELKSKRVWRQVRYGVLAGTDVVVAVGAGVGSASIGAGVLAMSALGGTSVSTTGGVVVLLVGGTATAGAVTLAETIANKLIEPINPFEQRRIAQTLSNNVLEDQDVYVDNLDKFVKRLETALN